MIKKYIKGNPENPDGVIKALENLGGQNKHKYEGSASTYVYFITKDGVIEVATKGTKMNDIIIECFEEIQPVEPAPKIITNLDVVKWYFDMIHKGHAVQFAGRHDYIMSNPFAYANDDDETEVLEVRVDFGEWIPIKEVGIK